MINTNKSTCILKNITVMLLIMLTLFSSISTFAVTDKNPSPTKEKEYILIVKPQQGGTGSRQRLDNEEYPLELLIAKPKRGYTFTHWVIQGKYKIIEGSLNSIRLKIKLYSDCVAIPHFVNSKGEEENTKIKINKSNTSPKTGDKEIFPPNFGFIMLGIIVGVIILIVVVCNIELYNFRKKFKKSE